MFITVEFLKIFQRAEFNKISLSSVINTNLLNKKWMHQTTFYDPSYTNKKMCKKAHIYILYFMFVCIVCFIWFFICFAVVSIFCNKFVPRQSCRCNLFSAFIGPHTSQHIYRHNIRKYQILSHTFRNQLYCISAWKTFGVKALNARVVTIYSMVEMI